MTKEDIIKPENLVYQKPRLLNDNPMHYCPGCSHGVVHKLIAEVIDEMGMAEKAVGVSPVGCAVFMYNYLDIDCQEAAHGRAPALATAIKRLWPDRLVFTYQGDGDLACIGTAETIHALNRGENITIIFINNAIYGMTGGQMAPTTLVGMKTSTCPYGRVPEIHGYPLKMTEIAELQAGRYCLRNPPVSTVSGCHPQGQESHPQGIRMFHAEKRLQSGRNRIYLQLRMENDTRSRQQMDGRTHVPLLPAGRPERYYRK